METSKRERGKSFASFNALVIDETTQKKSRQKYGVNFFTPLKFSHLVTDGLRYFYFLCKLLTWNILRKKILVAMRQKGFSLWRIQHFNLDHLRNTVKD